MNRPPAWEVLAVWVVILLACLGFWAAVLALLLP